MCSLLSRSIGPTHGKPCNVGGLEDALRPSSNTVGRARAREQSPSHPALQRSRPRRRPVWASSAPSSERLRAAVLAQMRGSQSQDQPRIDPLSPTPSAPAPRPSFPSARATMPASHVDVGTSTTDRPLFSMSGRLRPHMHPRRRAPRRRVTSSARLLTCGGQSRPVRLHASSLPSSPSTSSWPSGARESFVVHRLVGAGTGARASGA